MIALINLLIFASHILAGSSFEMRFTLQVATTQGLDEIVSRQVDDGIGASESEVAHQ